MYVSMKHPGRIIDKEKPKLLEINLPHCYFVHHKFHMDYPGV